MPALTEARRHLPQARFSWLVEEAFAPLVRLHPAVAESDPGRDAALAPRVLRAVDLARDGDSARAIRAHAYDEIVDTQGLFRSALMAKVARGRRHGYDAAEHSRALPHRSLYDVRHRVARDLHADRPQPRC